MHVVIVASVAAVPEAVTVRLGYYRNRRSQDVSENVSYVRP